MVTELLVMGLVLVVKTLPVNTGDVGDAVSVPGLGRSPRGRDGNPRQYSLPGEPYGQRSPVGYSPKGRKKLNTTKVT